MKATRARKAWSRPRQLAFLGALIVGSIVAFLVIEAVFTPWARSLTGAPTLTGEWLGEMTTATGRKYFIWLDLEHSIPTGRNSCSNCSSIEGMVRTCDETGVRDYRIWGDVENWRGTQFYVKTLEEKEYAGTPVLGTLHGKWSGDTISLMTQLIVRGETTTTRWDKDKHGVETHTVPGGHPDTRAAINWSMHRGAQGDLEKRCDSATHNRSIPSAN